MDQILEKKKWFMFELSIIGLAAIIYFSKILVKKKQKQKQLVNNFLANSALSKNLILKNPCFFYPKNKLLYVICFTGGPCGGKTSTIDYIATKLSKKGINVLKMEETPTLIVKGGGNIRLKTFTNDQRFIFFEKYLNFQIECENIYREIANNICEGPTAILCDRGVSDAWGYMSDLIKSTIKNTYNLNENKMLNERYDGVLHLVTAADGAENFYNLSTNNARHEKPEEAKIIDNLLQKTYLNHRNLCIVDNQNVKSFEEKMEKAYLWVEEQFFFQGKNKKYEKIQIKPINFDRLNVSYMKYRLKTNRVIMKENTAFSKKTIKKFIFENWFLYTVTKQNANDGLKYRRNLTELEYETMLKKNPYQHEEKQIIAFIFDNKRWVVEWNEQDKKVFLKLCPEAKLPDFIQTI